MKMTKSKLRSFQMKQVNSETGSAFQTASIVQLSSAPSNENEYWSNVKFSIDTNSYSLTYANKRGEFTYSFFDPPFYAGGKPENRPKISDIDESLIFYPDCSCNDNDNDDDCECDYYYGYKYNGKEITTSYNETGGIRIFNQPELPLRFIIIKKNDDGEDDDGDLVAVINTASYFYVDVDINKNVTLSK